MTQDIAAPDTLQTIAHLLEAGKTDTVYRDLYLQRARGLLAPWLPHSEYLHWEHEKIAIDNLLRQNRTAVEHGDWGKVKELSGRIRTLRQLVSEKHAFLALGQAIYDALVYKSAPGLRVSKLNKRYCNTDHES